MQQPQITEPEEPTYFDVFNQHLIEYDKHHNQPLDKEQQAKRSYSLQEDLKLIIACSSMDEVHNKDFKRLEVNGIVNRTHWSIRDRFRTFLTKLTQADLEKIVIHLKQHGAEGFLVFSASQTDKELLSITLKDPKSSASQQERRISQERGTPQKKIRSNENNPIVRQDIIVDKQVRGKPTDKLSTKNKRDPTFPRNEKDKFQLSQLDQMLDLLAQWKKVPKAVLVVKLHQLSANLPDLDDYFMTMNEKYCWLEEEDMLLAQAKTPNSVEIKLLTKQKGLERLKRRIKYLHCKLPFVLE